MARAKPIRLKAAGPPIALSCPSFAMKNRTTSASSEPKPGSSQDAVLGNRALDLIIKHAYRRHSRGRIARAAMASCLGI